MTITINIIIITITTIVKDVPCRTRIIVIVYDSDGSGIKSLKIFHILLILPIVLNIFRHGNENIVTSFLVHIINKFCVQQIRSSNISQA